MSNKKEKEEPKEDKKSKEEIKQEEMLKIKAEERSLIDSWRIDAKRDSIIQKDCYFEMDNYIDMVILKKSYGVVISSRGGTGKTFTTITKLTQADVDFSYLDSFTTPQAFYIWLYKNRFKVKVLDDVYGLLENNKCNAMLKACLWEVPGKHRIVSYQTTKPLQDENGSYVPESFEEEGSIIILTNDLKENNPHVSAILTRVNHVRIEMTNKEMLEIMEEVVKKPYHELTKEQRMEVLDFMKDNSSESILGFNLRTLIKGYNLYELSMERKVKDLWQRLMMKMLKKDDKLLLVEELEKDESLPDVNARVNKYIELCNGKGSRATYMRLKQQLGLTGKKKDGSPETDT